MGEFQVLPLEPNLISDVILAWNDSVSFCYVYGLCLPLQTYLLADKWLIM